MRFEGVSTFDLVETYYGARGTVSGPGLCLGHFLDPGPLMGEDDDGDDGDDEEEESPSPRTTPTPTFPFAAVPRLVYVEVEAIHYDSSKNPPPRNTRTRPPALNAAVAKQQLLDWSIQSLLLPQSSKFIVVTDHHRERCCCDSWQPVLVLHHETTTTGTVLDDVLWLESSDPLAAQSQVPVKCRGYVRIMPEQQHQYPSSLSSQPHKNSQYIQVMVDEATLVRVVDEGQHDGDYDWKMQLTGEAPVAEPTNSNTIGRDVGAPVDGKQQQQQQQQQQQRLLLLSCGCWDDSVVRQLQCRPIGRYLVGTARITSSQTVRASLDAYYDSGMANNNNNHQQYEANRHRPILVVQDETSPMMDVVRLLQATCRTDQCHVVRYGAVRAKYGVYADWGLACTVHCIALACAVRNHSVSIILVDFLGFGGDDHQNHDHHDDDDHRRLQQYFERLVDGLQRQRTIVFPDNPLYGGGISGLLTGSTGGGGVRLAVRMNLIITMSAATNPRRGSSQRRSNSNSMDYITVPRTATVETRLRGLRYVLDKVNVDEQLGDPDQLRCLAENVGWLQGSVLARIRHRVPLTAIQRDTAGGTTSRLSLAAFETILSEFGPVVRNNISAQELRAGGNDLAKQALDDALNPEVELESLGLTAPTGILLYGPPGTGTYIKYAIYVI
jgi:hypothetical protein